MKITNISKKFKHKQILNNITLEINEGDFVLLLGINGSGKSTIIKLLSGLIRTEDFKEIKLDSVAYLPEKLTLPKTIAVKDYVRYLESENTIDLTYYINYLNIPNKLIKELSKGNLQKLGLLYLISSKKKYLLLDEPTEGMDVDLKKKFIDILRQEHEKGKTIIVSTHQKKDYTRLNPIQINIKDGVIVNEVLD